MIFLIIFAFLLLLVMYFVVPVNALKNWFRAAKLALKLPGPKATPFLGNIFLLKGGDRFIKFLLDARKYERSLVRGWVSFLPLIGIGDPKHIQVILSSTKHTDKQFMYGFINSVLGNGLITRNGEKWKLNRHSLQPFFHKNVLQHYIDTFEDSANYLVEQLQGKEDVNIVRYVNKCVENVVHCAFLGVPIRDETPKLEAPFNKGHLMLINRLIQPWYMWNFAYKFSSFFKQESNQELSLQLYAKQVLNQRRQRKENNNWCLLDSLIELAKKSPQFNDKDIEEEISSFMLVGQDSVAGALAYTLYCLGKYPEIQQKVVEELDEVFEKHSETTIESVNDMVYLEQCIKESMRLYPTVPLFSRTLGEDVQLGKHTLPAGLNVIISPMATHRLKHYHPEPNKFNPDRFSRENVQKLHPYAFIPFSGGPRNCIANKFAYLELKVILSTILRKFVITVPDNTELKLMYRVTLRAHGGINLRIMPR